MFEVEKNLLFRKWTDPISGIDSYLLDLKPAPLVQSFYFLSDPVSADGRYLWFYCVFPPSGDSYHGRCLGNIDLVKNRVFCFHETQFTDMSPLIDKETGDAYWVSENGIYRRGPKPEDKPSLIAEIPDDVIRGRMPRRIATHLTFSADRKSLAVDIEVGRQWIIGSVDIETGRFEVWQEMDRCYNHAQFSPSDNDLMMIAQDWWHDCVTGERTFFENRIWLIRKGGKARPIYEGVTDTLCHEWWSADGQRILYVDYETGTYSYDMNSGKKELIWPGRPCHSHCSKDERMFVGDVNDYTWDKDPCSVLFYDRDTGKQIAIASDLAKPRVKRSRYHIDPHPRFVFDDEYVIYTTSEDELFTLALTKVEDIKARLTSL